MSFVQFGGLRGSTAGGLRLFLVSYLVGCEMEHLVG